MALDILFLSPSTNLSERYSGEISKQAGGHLPPLGLASLAAYLRFKKFSVDILDLGSLNLSFEELLERIKISSPKVLAFSALTVNFYKTRDLALALKKFFPNQLYILGGHHATIAPSDGLISSAFDFVCRGEGEISLEKLMLGFQSCNFERKKIFEERTNLEKIPGISYLLNGEEYHHSLAPVIENLDELPYPARDLLPMSSYIPLPNQYLSPPVVHMNTARGCPYQCLFCSNNAIFGKRVRKRSVESVIQEIRFVQKNYGAKEISFWDDTLTTDEKWTRRFCEALIEDKVQIHWTCYARIDSMNPEILALMKKAGCWNIFYGIESGSQEILDLIDKKISLDEIRKVVKWTKEAGIEIRGSFMLGLPGETPVLGQKTIDFAKELDVDYAQFSLTTPFPQTPLWNDVEKYGTLSKDFSKYNGWSPVFLPYGYKNEKELFLLSKKAVKDFYFRPSFFVKSLKKIRSFADFKRYLLGAFFLFGFIKKS